MGFDDLARHMASRDGNKQLREPAGTPEQIVAEAQAADRRMRRTRDLILGPLLLVGGLVCSFLLYRLLYDALYPTPNPLRPPDTGRNYYPVAFSIAALLMVVFGLRQTIRGIRGPR